MPVHNWQEAIGLISFILLIGGLAIALMYYVLLDKLGGFQLAAVRCAVNPQSMFIPRSLGWFDRRRLEQTICPNCQRKGGLQAVRVKTTNITGEVVTFGRFFRCKHCRQFSQ